MWRTEKQFRMSTVCEERGPPGSRTSLGPTSQHIRGGIPGRRVAPLSDAISTMVERWPGVVVSGVGRLRWSRGPKEWQERHGCTCTPLRFLAGMRPANLHEPYCRMLKDFTDRLGESGSPSMGALGSALSIQMELEVPTT